MAAKDKKARSIDQPSSSGFQGGITVNDFTTVPPAPSSVPAPFNLAGTSTVLFSAVAPSIGVALTWVPGMGTNPQSYMIQYSRTSTFPDSDRVTEIASTNSALIDALMANTTYYFRVAAQYRSIMSPWSDVLTILTTSDLTPPDPVAQSSMSWSWPIGDLLIKWSNPTSTNLKDVHVEIWSDSAKTVKLVDTYSSTGSYVFTADQNFSVTSGNPDSNVYVELTSRSWSNILSTATTFGSASTPTTQPIKVKPATPTGVTADFTGRDAVFNWNGVTNVADYVITIDGIAYVSMENGYVYTFARNKVQHSGVPDPILTYTIVARDGLRQSSDPTTTATATNTAPTALIDFVSTWDGDVGYADEDVTITWNTYGIPADLDYFEVSVSRNDNTGLTIYRVTDKQFNFPFSENKRIFSTPVATVKISIKVVDAFAQTSAAYAETIINAAPPIPTVNIFAGFTQVYAQVTYSQTIRDFDHYTFTLRLNGTSGTADGTIIKTFDDVIDNPVLSIDTIGNYKIGVKTYDMFGQSSNEVVSSLVFIDALTITQLRAEGQYSDNISTDYTSDPTGKANNTILKDNAVTAGITYTVTTSTFGKTAVGGTTQDLASDSKRVSKYTLSQAGNLSKISAYISGVGVGVGNQVAMAVIYADSSGPTTLLGTSNEVTVVDGQSAGWVDFLFPTSVALTTGSYWIGLLAGGNSNTIRMYKDSGSSLGRYALDTYSDGASSPFGSATTLSHDYSVTATVTLNTWNWTQFERPVSKMYRRLTVDVSNGNPGIVFATGVINSAGTTVWRYWAGVAANGYSLTEYSTLSTAQNNAANVAGYMYGWAEIPVEVEARYVRMYHNGSFRLDEYYPRSMITSDDIQAESIRAINIASDAIVANKIAAGAVSAVKLSVGIGGGNLIIDGGFLVDTNNDGLCDAWNIVTSAGSATVGFYTNAPIGYKGQTIVDTYATTNQLYGLQQTITKGIRSGVKYTVTGYVFTDTGVSNGYICQLSWFDSSNTSLSSESFTFNNSVLGLYEKFSYTTSIAPTNSAKLDFRLLGNGTNGQRVVFAGIQVEEGDVATAWKPGYAGNVQVDGNGIMVGIFNGARTELTQGGLIGYNSSNVEQVRIDSATGSLIAGAGRVVLDRNGLALTTASSAFTRSAAIEWFNTSGTQLSYIDTRGLGMNINAYATSTSRGGQIILNAYGTDNNQNANTAGIALIGNNTTLSQASILNVLADTTNIQSYTATNIQSNTNVTIIAQSGSITLGSTVYPSLIGIPTITAANRVTVDGLTSTSNGSIIVARRLDGQVVMYNRNDGAYNFISSAWVVGSDRERKENIQPLQLLWNDFMKIEPTTFDYKSGKKNTVGFIAQDIQKIESFAHLVERAADGFLGLHDTGFIPYMVIALQDLKTRLHILERKTA